MASKRLDLVWRGYFDFPDCLGWFPVWDLDTNGVVERSWREVDFHRGKGFWYVGEDSGDYAILWWRPFF